MDTNKVLDAGEILSGNRVVAVVKDGLRTVTDPEHCPLYLLRWDDVEGWLRHRSIDGHRMNSRLLRRALHIGPYDDLAAVLRVHGAALIDDYWYRAASESLKYEDVAFSENLFSELALRGDPDSFQKGTETSYTPELTNTGSFEKCWKLLDGEWWMVKAGTAEEQFSEQFVYELGSRMGLDMAEYCRRDGYIYSRNFCGTAYNFEPMSAIYHDEDSYSECYRALQAIAPTAAAGYVGMVYLDALVLNMDRHLENYGVLRDRDTGGILRLAPLFDHNIALIARGYLTSAVRGGDILQRDFVELLKDEPDALRDFQSLVLIPPTNEMIRAAVRAASAPSDAPSLVRPTALEDMILSAQAWMGERIEELLYPHNAVEEFQQECCDREGQHFGGIVGYVEAHKQETQQSMQDEEEVER